MGSLITSELAAERRRTVPTQLKAWTL